MKKILTLVIIVMTLCTFVNAQNYLELNVTQFDNGTLYPYCATIDSIIINQDGTCQNNASWLVSEYIYGSLIFQGHADYVCITPGMGHHIQIDYSDCHGTKWFMIDFIDFEDIPEPWTEDVHWLNHGEQIQLQAPYSNTLNYLWSDGSTGTWFNVTGPEWSGKIWVRMYNDCGSVSDTINVYYNGDITMATVDPQTDHITVTWEVDPLLVGYLESLTIVRDGYQIATVPYIQGQYIDEAVSGSATSRTYRCKAIAKDGSVCDFNSAPKPSIHMVYTVGYFGTVEMQFNDVSTNYEDLYQYYISEWNDGEITHVDSIMPGRLRNGKPLKTALGQATMRDGVINYSAPESYFSNGYLIVEADLTGRSKDTDDKFLSNRSQNTVGIEAFETVKCSIFPNPATRQFTVTGLETGTLTLYNKLGQVILTQAIAGETIIEVNDLPSGVYFAKISTPLGVCSEKVVVE